MPQDAQIALAVAMGLTVLWGGFIVWWYFVRPRQAGPALIEAWTRQQGYQLIRSECRWPPADFSARGGRAAMGPFAGHLWGGMAVFWVEVVDDLGQQRRGWLRLGTPVSLRGRIAVVWEQGAGAREGG
jgi:hypothetical protein